MRLTARFVPFGHKVVDKRAYVPVAAAEDERRLALQLQRRIHARDEALRRGLLIA